MNSAKRRPAYTVAELFCGCGGFSHGFSRTGRFRAIFGNDVKAFALKTFELNHANADVPPIALKGDIREVSDGALIKLLATRGFSGVDVLLGGPPCQGFSQMRRGEERRGSKIVRFGGYNKLDHDPRNDLVLRFLEVAAALNPKVIVIENVPQFLSHYHDGKKGGVAQQVEEVLGELGYTITCGVLNAADFGVPQLRQRAVVMASRTGRILLPIQTHGDPELLSTRKPWVTVREAIADLPLDPPLHESLGGGCNGFVSEPVSPFSALMRTGKRFPYNHLTRRYERRIVDLIKQMRPGETWDDASERMRGRFDAAIAKAVSKGESHMRITQRMKKDDTLFSVAYKRYYWSAYTRLAWDRPALTITANANFLGSGRFTHPDRDRGITMREAARLQSFDDAFTFYTSEDDKHLTSKIGIGMDMIGEAVPPLLGSAIANTVAAHLDEQRGRAS